MTKFNTSTPPPSHDLPIVHEVIGFYKFWHAILPHFPTPSRNTLGSRIDILTVEISELLFSAVFLNGTDKIQIIESISKKLDSLKFLLRLAWEVEVIRDTQYAILSKQLVNIGKQLGSWLRQLRKLSAEGGEKHG